MNNPINYAHSVMFAQILSSWIHAGLAENDNDDRAILLAWNKI